MNRPPTLGALLWRWGEMIRFSHSVFALPFALMSAFLAARAAHEAGDAGSRLPGAGHILLIIGCMVTARSAAMTFNRLVDARIDARNPRTAGRAIPSGTISPAQAKLFLAACALGFGLCCAGFVPLAGNWIPLALSPFVLACLLFYSYTKRFTRWSHLVLGSVIALSPPAAWLAIHPASIGLPAILLMAAVTCWIGGFDIIYACQDIDFDRSAGLFSLPASVGPRTALWVARGCHAATVGLLAGLASAAGLGWLYAVGVVLVAALLAIENALVRADDLSRVNLAFFTINGIVSLLLAGLTIADCLLIAGPPAGGAM